MATDVPPCPEPRVAAFEQLAFGMFVHWGLYSQLGYAVIYTSAESGAGLDELRDRLSKEATNHSAV